MIGMTGAHRVGKTTMGKLAATRLGIPFVSSSSTAVHERLGLSPSEDMPFSDRVLVQREILTAAEEDYKKVRGPFISDRTPLDFLTYLMLDVQRDTVRPEAVDMVAEFVGDTFSVVNAYFSAIVIVPPAIPYVVEPGKPRPCPVYQAHFHWIAEGLANDSRLRVPVYRLPFDVVDINARAAFLSSVNDIVVRATQEALRGASIQ